ncbi:helix-turn-helix domain-containing protein [Edaphocola aurantiacus]|uniref:helix-turn-helix domain-containing protein n=1 Tax=Edaphocola aurantiacus TaxID=2601682 RepID=UPI001C9558F7|nr:AraC family transcriptional regulator [Edaphocola aurantiacus]
MSTGHNDIIYREIPAPPELSDFVDSIWMLHNDAPDTKEVIILPDGRIDLFLSHSATEPFTMRLMGMSTEPDQTSISPHTLMYAISFRPLATEYVLQQTVSAIVDSAMELPAGFWGFTETDLDDFEAFTVTALQKVKEHIAAAIDERKQSLFHLIHAAAGEVSVQALSDQIFWSSRQINRYFTEQYGLSLKTYCSILRFRASFEQIKVGELYPDAQFADQSHFIKAVKKLAGVTPKMLQQNKNDRFIQFSTLPPK